ncbi:MAG: hypothetical protein ACRD0P_16330, partial [Stackebrandtia sp.]
MTQQPNEPFYPPPHRLDVSPGAPPMFPPQGNTGGDTEEVPIVSPNPNYGEVQQQNDPYWQPAGPNYGEVPQQQYDP